MLSKEDEAAISCSELLTSEPAVCLDTGCFEELCDTALTTHKSEPVDWDTSDVDSDMCCTWALLVTIAILVLGPGCSPSSSSTSHRARLYPAEDTGSSPLLETREEGSSPRLETRGELRSMARTSPVVTSVSSLEEEDSPCPPCTLLDDTWRRHYF